MKRFTRSTPLVLAALALAGCDPLDPHDPTGLTPMGPDMSQRSAVNPATVEAFSVMMDATNESLAATGANYRVAVAEYITADGSAEAGMEVLAKNVGNKQLGHDFIPFDVRRDEWSGPADGPTDDITYAIDQTADAAPFLGASAEEATAAIVAAMDSWEAVSCSDPGIVRVDDQGIDLGVIAFDVSNGAIGSDQVVADMMHAGWRDLNFAGGVLGVTFTFIFIDEEGNPTDADGNGLSDTAFREIYYDPVQESGAFWPWNIGANIDIETVALHEAGHGLSQGHFGTVFLKNDGSLNASPRAVMNALYAAPFPDLTGTDDGGHCSLWADWPNN